MTAVYVTCPDCNGAGGRYAAPWDRCVPCGGIGRTWTPGAPAFGCVIKLADRDPGEIVTLGNGDRGRILWHMPRRKKKVVPETTFLGLLDEFTDRESYTPTMYPACVGVSTVDESRRVVDLESHDRDREIDYNDPVQRTVAGRLI